MPPSFWFGLTIMFSGVAVTTYGFLVLAGLFDK